MIKKFILPIFILTTEILLSQVKSKYYCEEFSKLKPHNVSYGLLIGLNSDSGYRTLFIINKKDTAIVALNLPYLASPQGKEFCFIDEVFLDSTIVEENDDSTLAGYCVSNSELFVIKEAGLLKKNSKYTTGNDSIGCEAGSETNAEYLHYIIPNYISLGYSYEGYQTGAAHGYNSYNSKSMNFDYFYKHTHQNLDDSILPFDLNNMYITKKEYVDSILHFQLDSLAIEEVTLDDISYYLKRQNGEVHLYCHASTFADYMHSEGDYASHAVCDIGPLDNLFVKNNVFPLDYNLILDQLNQIDNFQIQDILISPSEDIVYLVLYNNETYKCNFIGIDIKSQKEILNYPLTSPGIVMVEWVTGKQINKWKKVLKKQISYFIYESLD